MSKSVRKFVWNVEPTLKMSRSKFDLSYKYDTSMNVGDLCPVYIQEIYPGDTFKVKTTFVARTLSPYIRPVMDNLYLDMYYFFVPNRLVWRNWQAFNGENVNGYWANNTTYEIPQVKLPYSNDNPVIAPDTVAAYLGVDMKAGLPVGATETAATITELPFRAFALIYNEWFRNENFEPPVYINLGNTPAVPDVINNNAWSNTNIVGKVPKVNKLADYFTACLPAPQKGAAVDIPIGDIPVLPLSNKDNLFEMNEPHFQAEHPIGNLGLASEVSTGVYSEAAGDAGQILGVGRYGSDNYLVKGTGATLSSNGPIYPDNLFAIGAANTSTINDLRFAFQLQKMLERDARGGTRYAEVLLNHWSVMSPDARLQRPEFLGGKRTPLQLQEVAQTSESSSSSPLAQLSAYSATINNLGFSKGFVEHGFVIGVACIRYKHTYQQGIERFWWRKNRYDFYDPVFANIGEQPVYKREIFADGIHAGNTDTIFGYNEAWADLRFRPGRVTGVLNTCSGSGFDIWHFGDDYANAPTLNNSFMKETSAYVDRTLSVPSSTAPNFIIDMYHTNIAARILPTYSIPGLVDHH